MKVMITGAAGMLGRSLTNQWQVIRPDDQVVPITRTQVDLRSSPDTARIVRDAAPDLIVHTAARVGGIQANMADPTGFLLDNLLIDSSVISAALESEVKKLIYIGSSCMYPRDFRQPLVETDILAAPLEPTNEGYALAKISAARLCSYASAQYGREFRVIIPSNLYGPYDDFAPQHSHLVAASLEKVHRAQASQAPTVEIWGTGTARREFTFVVDLADWLIRSVDGMALWPDVMNVGCGEDHSVGEFYEMAKEITGYRGRFVHDLSKPEGMARKLMDSSRARQHGWNPSTSIRDGMAQTYRHYLALTAERGAIHGD